MALIIRDATDADAAAIADIYNEAIAAGGATMDDDPWTADDVRTQMAGFSSRELYLVVEDEGRTLGWGVIKLYSHKAGYRFCAETSVFLRQARVRQGHGSRLKHALIDRCRDLGYHHLIARIFADNKASIEYNKAFGYEVVGVQREIGFKDGRWQDVAVMQLLLDD